MGWFEQHLLSILVSMPIGLGVIGLLFPKAASKSWALFVSLAVFASSLVIWLKFDPMAPDFQLGESYPWISSLGITYSVGVDGISFWLLLLTTALMPLVIWSSFSAVENREKEYYFLLLALETAMLGAFVSLDMFLFYIFWEAMLIPMYFLIGIWGGKDRIYATLKFFLYTLVGSLMMLVALFYLSYQHKVQFGGYTMGLDQLMRVEIPGGSWLAPQSLLFLAFALAFAIKVPLFPLHTWLPDAHVQAPTAGSVVLAAILLKMGGYGFLRFAFPLFPDAVVQYREVFLALASIAIVYGAWVATVQPDIKKLVAYSSVSHMGYVVLGLFALNKMGATGAMYQMLNHGVSTGALFLLVGMIYERRHTREISEFGGLTRVMPRFAVLFMIVTLSSVALPGTNGFVGEFLILLGTWLASKPAAIVAATGVIFGAVYMLWMFQRVMFGKVTNAHNKDLNDLSVREMLILAPFILAIFWMGFFPSGFFEKMQPSLDRAYQRVQAHALVKAYDTDTKALHAQSDSTKGSL